MEINVRENESSIKLIKGQKDSYGWEIKAYNKDLAAAVEKLKEIDKMLRERFLVL